MLAKQVFTRRPQLPGGRQLRVRADRPLLKRATAGLLLNPSPSSSAQEEGFAPLYQVLILSTLL